MASRNFEESGLPASAGKGGLMADVYRWLRVGNPYTYVARGGKGDDSRRGQRCIVETVPRPGRGPGNARVRFADGHVAIVPAGALRKAEA